MIREPRAAVTGLVELVTVHALTWLGVGSAVGLLLATLLLWPRAGDLLAPWTYGRWMPVHLDALLYGWCGLPLVGLLLRAYVRAAPELAPAARWAVGAWSGSLALGCVSWLRGGSSGKLFLEWSGWSRVLFAASLGLLALVLAAAFGRERWRSSRSGEAAAPGAALRAGLLALLLPVPAILYWAASPRVYPSINPDSGGATGSSLLGSTLGVLAILCLVPWLAGLERLAPRRELGRPFGLLGLHFALFALVAGGDHSHHEPTQIAALATLLVWPPVLRRYLRGFRWPEACRGWLAALAVWGAALVTTAMVTFLPGVLERAKFTNALVAHAHLAMAGFATSLVALVLLALARGGPLEALLAAPRPFRLWQAGCALQVASLLVLGVLEARDPGVVIQADPAAMALYGLRWLGGAAMATASWSWLRAALRLRRAGDRELAAGAEPASASEMAPA